jgi:hypothetical protein
VAPPHNQPAAVACGLSQSFGHPVRVAAARFGEFRPVPANFLYDWIDIHHPSS